MVMVDATSPEETIDILENIKDKYEEHHHVTYTKEAIEACVKLSDRYVSDRYLPDKAIDVMDEAGAKVHINNIHVPDSIVKLEDAIEDWERFIADNCEGDECARIFNGLEERHSRLMQQNEDADSSKPE